VTNCEPEYLRRNSEGIALDSRGSTPSKSKTFFFSPQRKDKLCGPPSLLSYGYWGHSPRVYGLGHEPDHSPPANAGVTNVAVIAPPQYVFMA
jgi:hypothetical protein